MERVFVFDTTLRDGEQSPGASMALEQKYELALQLSRLGVDIIEAGFPVSSPHQFKACHYIAENVKGPTIAVLARALTKDLDTAIEAVQKAQKPRIHTFIATSPLHMKYKLGKDPETVIEMAVEAVKYARKRIPEVEFSPEDATRSELPFLCRVIEKVIEAGATIINIPDTVGYSIPEEFGSFIKAIKEGVPNIDKAIISVHCHNDLGLGVANTLAGVCNGARQVEVTLNGIGERAGNASLEEFVMTLYVRRDRLPYYTNIVTTQIYHSSKMLAGIIGFPIPRNKPIVGENAFAHESGIHQDGVLKKRETYEIMTPQSVGRDTSKIILGRHSGLHGFKQRLTELGFKLEQIDIQEAYDRFLQVADRKKEVYDDDLFVILGEQMAKGGEVYLLDYFSIQSGNKTVPTASVRLKIGDDFIEEAATGDGPVDAIFKAIDRVTGIKTKLLEYTVQAVTPEKTAMGEVVVTIQIEDISLTGRGASTDILEASAKAYLNALNHFKNMQQLKIQKGNG